MNPTMRVVSAHALGTTSRPALGGESNVVKAKRVLLHSHVQAPAPAVHLVTKAVRIPLTAAAAEALRRKEAEKQRRDAVLMTIGCTVQKVVTKAVRVPLTAAAAAAMRRQDEEKRRREMTPEEAEKLRAEEKRAEEKLEAKRQAEMLRRASEARAKRKLQSEMRRRNAVVTKARRVLITDVSYYDDEE